jgi:hypothetical protein
VRPAAIAALVPAEVGALTLFPVRPPRRRGSRSYAHDGRCLECVPAPGFELAADVEALDAPAAPELALRLGLDVPEFLAWWTRLEVTAKLDGVQAVRLLQRARRGKAVEPPAGAVVRTAFGEDLAVSVGWRRARC